jgi:hypothetical protein
MKREPLVLEPTGVWGRSPHIAFSRYAALRGGDPPLLAAGFFIVGKEMFLLIASDSPLTVSDGF